MRRHLRQPHSRFSGVNGARVLLIGLVVVLALAVPLLQTSPASAVLLTLRSLQVSDGTAGSTGVRYNFGFSTVTSGPIGSLKFQICSNYQYEDTDPCTPPVGLDASTATLTGQTGITDFTIDPSSTNHILVLARPVATAITPQPLTIEFSGITNPTNVGSYYVRISTYASTDGSGAETDYGIVVFAMNRSIDIQTEVPPFLLFCTGITIDNYDCSSAAGSFIGFGELSSTTPRTATSQMVAATNAPYGYSVTLAGTTMTAGNNVIPAMSGQTSRPGTSQFGLNARSNSSPSVGSDPIGPGLVVPRAAYNVPNTFTFASGDIIASTNDSDDYRKLTVSYLVNASSGQPPGRYVATVSYICLANF